MTTTTTTTTTRIGDYTVAFDPTDAPETPWVVLEDGDAVSDHRTERQAIRAATAMHTEGLRDRLVEAASRCKDIARLEAALAALEGTEPADDYTFSV